MAKVNRFEELEVWQEARKIASGVYQLTFNEGFNRDFSLMDQIRRSVISVMANIAEGFHRGSNREFVKFLGYSRGSLAETISHLYVALDRDYINEKEMKQINH